MTGREIIRRMVKARWHDAFCLPNYTPAKWWECDVFELTKSGYVREYEVKVSRADFFADAAKEKEVRPRPYGAPAVMERKHDLLTRGDPRGPCQFWYVTPEGMLRPSEVPEFAGLIEVSAGSCTTYVNGVFAEAPRIQEREFKPAPRLHREKASDDVRKHSLSVCYYRFHELLHRQAA